MNQLTYLLLGKPFPRHWDEPVGWVRIPSDSDRPTDFLFDHMVEQSRRISFGVWFPVFYKSNNREYEELRAIIDNGSESMTHEDAVKELRRLMYDFAPDIPEDWHPIETVPNKKGTHFLLFGNGASFRECVFVGYFDGRHWRDMTKFDVVEPTHWMPLPTSPEESPSDLKRVDGEYVAMQEQLAASQARERQLRDALGKCSAQLTRLGYSANHADEAPSIHRDVSDPQPCALVSTNEIEYGRVIAEFDYMKLMAQRDDCVIQMQHAATEIEFLREQLAAITKEWR